MKSLFLSSLTHVRREPAQQTVHHSVDDLTALTITYRNRDKLCRVTLRDALDQAGYVSFGFDQWKLQETPRSPPQRRYGLYKGDCSFWVEKKDIVEWTLAIDEINFHPFDNEDSIVISRPITVGRSTFDGETHVLTFDTCIVSGEPDKIFI